jgi:hypothetical protein
MNLLGNSKGSSELQNFKNPFDKDGVNSVTFHIHRRPSMFRKDKKGEATVYFSKGDTEGKQVFYADDFKDLVSQVDAFINSLK